ncbi:MAG: hypothetical protein ACLSA6_08540 [Holdemania massiliensis]
MDVITNGDGPTQRRLAGADMAYFTHLFISDGWAQKPQAGAEPVLRTIAEKIRAGFW